MTLARVEIGPVREVTFAKLALALAGEVAEADALFQLRQRQAWREATGGSSGALEGLDRLGNLGIHEVCLSFQLEPDPRPWYRRLWGVLAGAGARGASFRFAGPGHAPGTPVFQVSVRVGRSAEGAWSHAVEGLPPGAEVSGTKVPALDA